MIQCFFCSLFGSSTRQQIKLSQVENLKEILCSSGTKLKLLAGSREFYGDWKGTSFGSFPSTCVSACVQMVGALELSKYSLIHTHTKAALLCDSALLRLQLERARFLLYCPKCLHFSRMQYTSSGEPGDSGGGRGILAEGRLLSRLLDCHNLVAKPCRLGHTITGAMPRLSSHLATCFRALEAFANHTESVSLCPNKPL